MGVVSKRWVWVESMGVVVRFCSIPTFLLIVKSIFFLVKVLFVMYEIYFCAV